MPVPPNVGNRIAKAQKVLTSSYQQYADWPAVLVFHDGGTLILKSASAPRTGAGLFGEGTVLLDAGSWRPDGETNASNTSLELNPACIAGIVERKQAPHLPGPT